MHLSTTYADLTWRDPSSPKRWLQRRRITDALRRIPQDYPVCLAVDYGGGDGVLAERAASRWPEARIVVFEPHSELAQAARVRLSVVAGASVVEREAELPTGADIVFCTEVLEHLPDAEVDRTLGQIDRLLQPGGRLVVGVPVEVGPMALTKGLFRRARRPKAYDGNLGRIWRAALGRAPADRPNERFGPDLPYHSFHLGFDHRQLRPRLEALFGPAHLSGSPATFAPILMNSEAYMTFTKPRKHPLLDDSGHEPDCRRFSRGNHLGARPAWGDSACVAL